MTNRFFRPPAGNKVNLLFVALGFWIFLDGLNDFAGISLMESRDGVLSMLIGIMFLCMGAAEVISPHRIRVAGVLRIISFVCALSWLVIRIVGLI